MRYAIALSISMLAANALAQDSMEPEPVESDADPDTERESDADADPEIDSESEGATEEAVESGQTDSVHVTSTPEGAAISVDGEPTGRVAPTDLELAPGPHEVRGTLDGHDEDHRHIEVPGTPEVHLTLVPIVHEPPQRVPRPASVLNYIFAGTLLAAGIAVATGPLITAIRAGECASSCDDPSEAERYEVGTQTVVWLSVSAAIFAGALVFALARPIRVSATASREAASLTLDARF